MIHTRLALNRFAESLPSSDRMASSGRASCSASTRKWCDRMSPSSITCHGCVPGREGLLAQVQQQRARLLGQPAGEGVVVLAGHGAMVGTS